MTGVKCNLYWWNVCLFSARETSTISAALGRRGALQDLPPTSLIVSAMNRSKTDLFRANNRKRVTTLT